MLSNSQNALIFFLLLLCSIPRSLSCFRSIVSFGDSLTDTGNLLLQRLSEEVHPPFGSLPYGQTHFGTPTGRVTDGRVVLDFLAASLGLPFVPPSLAPDEKLGFRYGVNFATGGATALDHGFFVDKGFDVKWTNYTLGMQLVLFKQLLPELCGDESDCKDFFSRSLFLMGEIGGNDYNHGFLQQLSFDVIRSFVPKVIEAISSVVTDLIAFGAKTIVVPGNYPIGCVPVYLTYYHSDREEYYDSPNGCIKWLNEFAEYHNHMLLEELDKLRHNNPSTTIIYIDYYNAAMQIFNSPSSFGFGEEHMKACCGGGGPYNYNGSVLCGTEMANVCDDPSKYISWDGLHLTEAAYKAIADLIIHGPFAIPSINSSCPSIQVESKHEEL